MAQDEGNAEIQAETDSLSLDAVKRRKKGLSLWVASVFIVGEMAGSGVLALPKALANAGWAGVVLLLFCCMNALYAGICLGRCWTILEERYSEYKEKNRYPYPAIAYRAFGNKMRYFVSAIIDINLFGVSTVFLLLSSQLIGSIAAAWGIYSCYWILILALILVPLMWLGTPEDFWPAAVVALLTTLVACLILIVCIADASSTSKPPEYNAPSMESFFLAFGTIVFSFGGAASFPTFQNDMKDRSKFPKAAVIGFIVLLVLYLPVAGLGYGVYGSALKGDVIENLPGSKAKTTIQVLLALHLFFAFLLVINAPAQEFEEFFRIPKRFGWKRVLLRSGMMVLVVFVAESIPKFDKVLSLVGGSATTLTSSVLPCLFYYNLCSKRDPQWPERRIPLLEKVYLIVIMVCGVVGGCVSTYSSIKEIVKPDSFNPPCYINITSADF